MRVVVALAALPACTRDADPARHEAPAEPEPFATDGSSGPAALTLPATSLGTDAFSANGAVYPRGLPGSWWFEYGETTAYGATTPARTLGPRLAAHYTESWDDGLGAWRGGSGTDLVHQPTGGVSGGFVRYMEPTGTDYNHSDGIGWLHLVQYFYPGHFWIDHPSAALGGTSPDFTDAVVEVQLRGVDWDHWERWPDPTVPRPFYRGDELLWWSQVDATVAEDASHMSNWAHTGAFLSDALYSGDWTPVRYELRADTRDWTYAGQDRSQLRDVYVYHPLREVMTDLDIDFFHLMAYIDDTIQLYGGVDFDELSITYRNHSVLLDSNGGTLVSAPGGSDAAALTDGWRFGPDRTWVSDPNPVGPLEFRFELADPVTVDRVLVHNDPDLPSRDLEVAVSTDGSTWTPVLTGALPEVTAFGPNFCYLLATGLSVEARQVRVTVTSGYQPEAWGLGEVELWGTGATMRTDDARYSVTEDLTGLDAGSSYHYRLVVETPEGQVVGEDRVYTVSDGTPEAITGVAESMGDRRARIVGVVNTFGGEGTWHFEVGEDADYNLRTDRVRTGPEITPRTFSRILDFDHADLSGFPAGSTVHWRIVYTEGGVTPDPADDVVYAGADGTLLVP